MIRYALRLPTNLGPAKEFLPSDDPDSEVTSFAPDRFAFAEKRRELVLLGHRIPLGKWKPT